MSGTEISPNVGRPTGCTDAVIEALCACLRGGGSIAASCDMAGISEAAYRGWRKRGQAGEQPFARFLAETTRALAEAEMTYIASVHAAATGAGGTERDWRAAAFWLTHGPQRARYRKAPSEVELGGPDGGPVRLQMDDLRQQLRKAAGVLDEAPPGMEPDPDGA